MAFSSVKFIIERVNSLVHRVKTQFAARPDFWIGVALGAAALVLYLRTMPPTVLDGDSGEYQYMAYILGVPHSTGYPLYILLAKLFTFLPIRDVAYRVNLFSITLAALTAPLVYWAARRVMRERVPALLATIIFAVTPSMWGGAIVAKTYALHLFLGVFALFLALRWHQDHDVRDFYWLALVFGLALTNHRIILFLAPALALVLWFNRTHLDRPMLTRGALLMLAPLLLYAYIPIRASQLIAQQDPANWALYTREDAILKGTITAYYNNTLQGFFGLVTGLDNSYKLGFRSPLEEANRIDLATGLLMQQFGVVGIALAVTGAIESFRRDRKIFALLLAAAVGIGFIAIYLRGISTVFYFSLAYFALALWVGFGIGVLLRWATRVHQSARSKWVVACASPRRVVLVLLLLPFSALVANYARLDVSDNYAPRDYAQAVLRDNLAQDAVVIAPWEVSQPIRYFQFTENQRPDLLVVHENPVRKQFWTMYVNARALGRPFYLVEFKPEFGTTPGFRSVQAIPLPLLAEPRPRYALQNTRIVKEVEILGYDLNPDPPQPGQPVRVLIYYRTLARMYPMYTALLSVGDLLGRPWLDAPGFPASFYYPTYRWQEGEIYRDGWSFIWPADAPSGLYRLALNWYVYDLESGKTDYDHENQAALGILRAGDFSAPQKIAHAQDARVGDGLTFLGWDSAPASNSDFISSARGQTLNLDLFWRADGAIPNAYTVFVHLVDASGQVVADADSPPFNGLFPTDRWTVGEILRDRHPLPIRADLAPGDYWIEIGMYVPTTLDRLPIESGSHRADQLVLARVNVR